MKKVFEAEFVSDCIFKVYQTNEKSYIVLDNEDEPVIVFQCGKDAFIYRYQTLDNYVYENHTYYDRFIDKFKEFKANEGK